MSITDELRRYISGPAKSGISHICEKAIANIADRIDAEHESACAAAYGNGVMSVPIALDESAWVKLPVDADGVPIHIGDVIAYKDNTLPKEVVALVPPSVVMVETGPRYADECVHYHERTVEDVLREFVSEYNRDDTELCDEEIIERFAAKLRLADDGRE